MFVNSELNPAELRRLDLNLLPVFFALMQARSVKLAAERLGLTAPAVSMALARLRRATDDMLFVRTRGGLEPTARASDLADTLAPCLHSLREALLGQRGFDPATTERVIRFATPDDLENYIVPPIVARLARDAPGVSLVLRPADFRAAPGQLDRGEADIALTATPALERRHRHEVLQANESFLVLFDPTQIKLRSRAPLTLDAYLAVPHLLRSPDGELSGLIDRNLSGMGLQRRVSVALSRFALMPYLLRSTPSVANVPATTARLMSAEFGLSAAPPPLATAPTFDVSLVWHARNDADPALVWFRQIVRDSMADLVP